MSDTLITGGRRLELKIRLVQQIFYNVKKSRSGKPAQVEIMAADPVLLPSLVVLGAKGRVPLGPNDSGTRVMHRISPGALDSVHPMIISLPPVNGLNAGINLRLFPQNQSDSNWLQINHPAADKSTL
ncbi:MAG: hypothetical protein HQK59_17410 [Deltaproteobacteria bacterium]|nr:hypothetical protein [Deltaproteobacteria bacterium]